MKKNRVFVNKNQISILILFHSNNLLTSLKQDMYTSTYTNF